MKLPTHPQSRLIRNNTTSRINDMTSVHPSDAWLIEDPHWEQVIVPPHVRKRSDGYSLNSGKARRHDHSKDFPIADIFWYMAAQEWLLTLITILLPYSQLHETARSIRHGSPYSPEDALFRFVCAFLPLVVHSTRALSFTTVWLVCK